VLDWAWPWLFVLLPLPWLVARLLPPARAGSGAALRMPVPVDALHSSEGSAPVLRWRRLFALLE